MFSVLAVLAHVQRHAMAYLLIAASAGIQLALISQPVQFLLANVLPDDAFYYFEIVRNITQGLGSTFDGTNLTNGYHPLWLVLLLPIFSLFSFGGVLDMEPIRIALGLSICINVLTGYALYRILGHFSKDRLLVLAGLFVYLFNPFVLFETINGLETALSLLCIAIFFLLTLRLERNDSAVQYILLGVSAGVMTLARLDTALYAVAVLCWVLFRKGWKYGFPRAVGTGLVMSLVVLPWLAWNYLTFDMVLTSASQTGALVSYTLNAQDHGVSLFEIAKATVYHFYNGVDLLLLTRTGAPWLLLVLVGVWCAGIVRTSTLPKRFADLRAIHVLALGFILLFVANVVVRWGGRPWYFMSFEFFIALLVVFAISSLSLSASSKKALVLILAILMSFFFYVSWSKHIRNQYVNQLEMYAMANWMSENLPHDTRVGVYNSGLIGYFSTVTVINLDGLVNNAVYYAMKEKRVWEYIQDERLEYIADFPISLSYRYKSFFGIEDVFSHLEKQHAILITPTGRNPEGIVLYKITAP